MPRQHLDADKAPTQLVAAVRRLGENIVQARLRRNLRQEDLARMAGISRPTLSAVESGSLGTGIGAYAAALWAMDLVDDLGLLGSSAVDEEGQGLLEARLASRSRASGSVVLPNDF
jgi:transcriptional regulator with XRE-family HTH domain